jgi:hypothetical protein
MVPEEPDDIHTDLRSQIDPVRSYVPNDGRIAAFCDFLKQGEPLRALGLSPCVVSGYGSLPRIWDWRATGVFHMPPKTEKV